MGAHGSPSVKTMRSLRETSDRLAPDRLSDRVSAAAYGSVLVLAALSVIGVAAVTLGYGVELVTGVGLATWAAHLFAELLGGHVQHREPLRRGEVSRAMVDGSPILAFNRAARDRSPARTVRSDD